MQVRLIAKTTGYEGTEYHNKSIDEIIVGIARISSSREVNDLFTEPHKLIRHCLLNQHWSIFSMANLTFEIITSRDMGRELLRHSSIKPQELSARYAEITEFEEIELREQSESNRQSSTKVIVDNSLNKNVATYLKESKLLYRDLLESNVARETARFILPGTAQTKLIMNGGIREWITTLNARLHNTAQKEVRLVAEAIRDIFIQECPIISKALYKFDDSYYIHILERLVLEKYKVYKQVRETIIK